MKLSISERHSSDQRITLDVTRMRQAPVHVKLGGVYLVIKRLDNRIQLMELMDEHIREWLQLGLIEVPKPNCTCEHGGAWRELPKIISVSPIQYCPACGGTL